MPTTADHDQLLDAIDRDTLVAFLHWLTPDRGGYVVCDPTTGDLGESTWERDGFTIGWALQHFILDRRDAGNPAMAAVNRFLEPLQGPNPEIHPYYFKPQ